MPRKSRKTKKAAVRLTYRLTRPCELRHEGEVYHYEDTFLEVSDAPWVIRWLARGDLQLENDVPFEDEEDETVSEETESEEVPGDEQ